MGASDSLEVPAQERYRTISWCRAERCQEPKQRKRSVTCGLGHSRGCSEAGCGWRREANMLQSAVRDAMKPIGFNGIFVTGDVRLTDAFAYRQACVTLYRWAEMLEVACPESDDSLRPPSTTLRNLAECGDLEQIVHGRSNAELRLHIEGTTWIEICRHSAKRQHFDTAGLGQATRAACSTNIHDRCVIVGLGGSEKSPPPQHKH